VIAILKRHLDPPLLQKVAEEIRAVRHSRS
jgi:hypothetical protein